MIALVGRDAVEKSRKGLAKVIHLQLTSPPCACGNPKSRRNETCGPCRAKARGKGKGLMHDMVPSIVDAFPGTGRCLSQNVARRLGRGKSSHLSCGVQWGNLDHRHCPCGDPIAAYWMPDLDRAVDDEEPGLMQVAEGCCGKCELRNLPLSQRVWTERVETEGHQETPTIRGKGHAAQPKRATDCSSTVTTGGLH